LKERDIRIYLRLYHRVHGLFNEKNFKRIAVCPFFLNPFCLSNEDIFSFFGKPVIDLTVYQISLFGKGRYYKQLVSDPEVKSPPEEYYTDDLDKVIKFYDQQYSILVGKRTQKKV